MQCMSEVYKIIRSKESPCARQPMSCSKCRKRHPTSLCGDFENWKQTSSNLQNKDSVSNGSSMKVSISSVTDITTMIVPVFVSSEDSIEPLVIYALLDSQSDSTFILDSVAEELKARSVDIDLKLYTMTTTSTIKCQKIKNQRIRGFYSEKIQSIPTAYTRDVIPINRLHIPTNMMESKWSHLQCLKNKIPVMQNSKIGMLMIRNDRNIAEKRRDQLKQRLGKSKNDDYKAFIEMTFEKHYAEICPDIEEKA